MPACKAACDAHDAAWYVKYKKWADEYFSCRTGASREAWAEFSMTIIKAAIGERILLSPRMSAWPSWIFIRNW